MVVSVRRDGERNWVSCEWLQYSAWFLTMDGDYWKIYLIKLDYCWFATEPGVGVIPTVMFKFNKFPSPSIARLIMMLSQRDVNHNWIEITNVSGFFAGGFINVCSLCIFLSFAVTANRKRAHSILNYVTGNAVVGAVGWIAENYRTCGQHAWSFDLHLIFFFRQKLCCNFGFFFLK